MPVTLRRAGSYSIALFTMDHETVDYAYYEYVEAIEENNLTIIKDAPNIEGDDE